MRMIGSVPRGMCWWMALMISKPDDMLGRYRSIIVV